jgi:hypothetical protein
MNKIVLLCLIALLSFSSSAQDQQSDDSDNLSPIDFGADFVNLYVWRGIISSPDFNIQPSIQFTKGQFNAGFWGSYAINNTYSEMDMFLAYSIGSFTLTLNDYFVEDKVSVDPNKFFSWKKKSTNHTLEACISFDGTENFPFTFTAATFLFGDDLDDNDNNFYSTYFELGYSKQIGFCMLELFVGGSPKEGYYSSGPAVVNVGVSLSKEIKITESFSLPLFTSLVVNPHSQDLFLIFGIQF